MFGQSLFREKAFFCAGLISEGMISCLPVVTQYKQDILFKQPWSILAKCVLMLASRLYIVNIC